MTSAVGLTLRAPLRSNFASKIMRRTELYVSAQSLDRLDLAKKSRFKMELIFGRPLWAVTEEDVYVGTKYL